MITETAVRELLGNRSSTFAGIDMITIQKPSAKFKNVLIEKHTKANVTIWSDLNDETNPYTNAVIKTANRIEGQEVTEFKPQDNWFYHTDCYSIVHHKTTEKPYLYAHFNSAQSEFTIDGEPATREDVAQYLTPSEAKKLLEPNEVTHVKHSDVMHTVIPRAISLESIQAIRACGSTIEA